MGFENGNKYSKGRPKGSQNRETKAVRQWIDLYLSDNLSTLEDKLNELPPKEYVKFFLSLLDFALPKLSRTQLVEDQEQTFKVIVEYQKEAKELDQI